MGMSLRKKAYLSVLLAIGITPNVWAAVTEDDLTLLEEEINTIKESRDTATKVSGYVDAEYINDSRPAAQRGKYGFRIHHMSLFVTKKFNRDWKFFSEVEFEDGVNTEAGIGTIFAEAINIDYQWRPSQYVRIGRDFTPAGIWSVDHYPPFVPTQERPLHIRKIFPQVIEGVNAHGTVGVGGSFMDYDVYVANGDSSNGYGGSSSTGQPGESDNNDQKALGGRLNFILPALKRTEVGVSVLKDTNTDTTPVNTEKTAYGVHGKVRFGSASVQAEYAQSNQKPQGGTKTEKVGYYLQALYDINRWTVGYRYDFYDADKSAKVDVTRNSFFVNYHVNPHIVWKLEHHIQDNQDPTMKDYGLTIASIAYYLGE